MITVTVLGSGSRGNAILVDGSDGSVLVDNGFGTRALNARLHHVHRTPETVHAVVLTHEHVDHASGAVAASARWGWSVCGTPPTLMALAEQPAGAPAVSQALGASGDSTVAGFTVDHCAVPHDAADCRALVLTDVQSGSRVGVVLDCGRVPAALPALLAGVELLVIESNHDADMLANGPYPRMLKQRIAGGRGHLSNAAAATLLQQCAHRGLRGVVLAHLSETNNTPALARSRATQALGACALGSVPVWTASQREPLASIAANGRTGPLPGRQLTLF